MVVKKKITPEKIVVCAREREEKGDWGRRRNGRQQASSPQRGLPPSTAMRSGSTPRTRYREGYESDDYRPSSRSLVSGKQQDRQHRDARGPGKTVGTKTLHTVVAVAALLLQFLRQCDKPLSMRLETATRPRPSPTPFGITLGHPSLR